MIGGGSAEVINAAGEAFSDVGVGTFKVVGAAGKVASSASNIAVTAGQTAEGLATVVKDTSIGVVSNSGKALTAAAGTAAKTVETVENLSARLENYTKEAQKQAQIKNETATFEIKNANDVDKAKIEADRQAKLQEIQNDLERKQKETAAEQERMLAELSANQTQEYLKTEENKKKMNEAYYYGFTKNNPGSRDTGSIPKWFGLGKWCTSYIPKTFVKTDNTGNIDIIFPEQPPTGTRPYFISAINRDTGEPITISFKTENYTWFGKSYRREVPVIKYKDEQNNDVELKGTMDYHEIKFVCPTTNRGGRSKRRRTNRRRTYRRSRTNKGRSNKRSRRR
jgi:hypothetical protein